MAVYKLSEDASETLSKIYEYSLLNFGEEKADEYYLSLHKAFELLAEQPSLGRKFHAFRRHEHASLCTYSLHCLTETRSFII